jgi:hypothetical protein
MGSEKIDFSENVFFERLRVSTMKFCLTVNRYNSLPGSSMPPHTFSYISLSIPIHIYIYIYIYISISIKISLKKKRGRDLERKGVVGGSG